VVKGRGPVVIIAALEQEAAALARHLERSENRRPLFAEWAGDLDGVPVVLALAGVGKVAAAMCAQSLCDRHAPRCLVSIGLAGALSGGPDRGHVIIASGAVQHDFDARPLTHARGVIPGLESAVLAADAGVSERLLFAAERALKESRVTIRSGLVLTGDQIVTSTETRDQLAAQFPGAVCLEMETAAVAQVAERNQVPWGALRITSDAADESFALDDVLEFGAATAGELFESIIRAVVREL